MQISRLDTRFNNQYFNISLQEFQVYQRCLHFLNRNLSADGMRLILELSALSVTLAVCDWVDSILPSQPRVQRMKNGKHDYLWCDTWDGV